ncbi:MAG: hypothetical protein WKF97_13815 [Chitinophagaceae bacterium]
MNSDSLGEQRIGLLHGHQDKGGECSDAPPRAKRFQVNDEAMVYVNGKILIIAREFRNRQQGYPPFRRLVFGLFDINTYKWSSHEPFTVLWSAMNPDSCNSRFTGINATLEIISLIDPKSGKPVILLFHNEFRNSMITGLSFDGKDLNLHSDYPTRKIFSKRDRDAVYGQRVLFDNGIYYMHVNAGSGSTKLRKDWPDRFQLFTALDPYQSTWTESRENSNKVRPYFTRGEEMDPDNAAIWQGTMFKFRNRYYMYYGNYHSINNRDNAYDLYDEAHSGSRVGYATAN